MKCLKRIMNEITDIKTSIVEYLPHAVMMTLLMEMDLISTWDLTQGITTMTNRIKDTGMLIDGIMMPMHPPQSTDMKLLAVSKTLAVLHLQGPSKIQLGQFTSIMQLFLFSSKSNLPSYYSSKDPKVSSIINSNWDITWTYIMTLERIVILMNLKRPR